MSVQLTGGYLPTASITDLEVSPNAGFSRSKFAINVGELLVISPLEWRVHDAISTLLPTTAAADDLGIEQGTFGTGCPRLRSSDAGNTTITQYARVVVRLPSEYVAAETVALKFHCGMLGVASASATLDVQAFKVGDDGLVDGSDLYTGSAADINSATLSTRTFALNATDLNPGDTIDVRITVAATDVAGSGKVAVINKVWLASDNRG